ncbi:MAG: trypsin-like serine protease [Ruminococcaceae bacterium]|nr:trypsin-like serine protease [Oscillospiraceae bacterium]
MLDDIYTMLENGTLGEDDIMSAFVQLYTEYLPYYAFTTGNSRTEAVSTGAVGTGFIVTPDGYLVTNAHVVETNEDELYYSFAVSNLSSVVETEVTTVVEDMRREGYQMSEYEINLMYETYFWLYAQNFDIGNLNTRYYCYMGNVQPGADISTKGVVMDVRKVGIPSTAKDVAILKMDGTNLPTIPLGDDATLKTGDPVYAMGYPAVATVYGAVDIPQAMQEPTLTQGIVSAKKQMDSGAVIQMDAAIHGGNSGGPLFNSAGEVIGINTFGLVDPTTGEKYDGINFAVPISTVRVYLNELNVTPSESKFTADFKKALAAYNSGDHQTALDLLHGINDTNPGYPVVQELLADARAAYDANPRATPAVVDSAANAPENVANPATTNAGSGFPLYLIIIIAAAVVVVAAVIIVVVVLGRKKRARTTAGMAAQGQPGYMPPAQPYAPPQPYAQPQPAQQPPPYAPQQQQPAQAYTPLQPQPPSTPAPAQQPTQQVAQPQPYAQPPQGAPPAGQGNTLTCPGCGAPLSAGSQFCNACGQKIP